MWPLWSRSPSRVAAGSGRGPSSKRVASWRMAWRAKIHYSRPGCWSCAWGCAAVKDTRGLVFTTKYGTPIEPGNLTRMFALRARRAGLRVIPLRNTRHTYAEASEEEVRAAMGGTDTGGVDG